MGKHEKDELDHAFGNPLDDVTSLEDVNATLVTISDSLEDIKDKLSTAVGCLFVIALLVVIYFWKIGLFNT
jgi:hypothetical protein